MSIVQLSRFVFLCRSFQATAFIFYQSFVRLSRTFLFFCFTSLITSASFSATVYLDYHIQTALSTTFYFFKLFQLSELFGLFPASETGIFSSRQLFRLRVSAWYSIVPYFLLFSRLFLSDLTIISSLPGIVNVFSIIYIIQTICTISYFLAVYFSVFLTSSIIFTKIFFYTD